MQQYRTSNKYAFKAEFCEFRLTNHKNRRGVGIFSGQKLVSHLSRVQAETLAQSLAEALADLDVALKSSDE